MSFQFCLVRIYIVMIMYRFLSLILIVILGVSESAFGQVEVYSKHETLGSSVNSSSNELNVVVSPDGNKIFFTRAQHPRNIGGTSDKGDVWVTERTASGGWTDATNMGRPLNDEGENRIIGFMDAGRAMLLHSENGIGFSYNENGKWLKPTEFKIPYFRTLSKNISGSISNDGRYLLFAMESYGTYGVEDLYMCRLKGDGSWTSPKNLGSIVNSAYEERTPFIASDNKTLFFASNGRGGRGSFDIFMSQRLDETWQKWSEPVNMGKLVNTPGRELSFAFRQEAEFAYLISTQNSDGYGDIKRVKITPNIEPEEIVEDTVEVVAIEELEKYISISGVVRNKQSNKAVALANIKILTDPDSILYETTTDAEGAFRLKVRESGTYEMGVTSKGYLGLELVLTDAEVLDKSARVYHLEPLSEGNTIQLSHVLFHQGTSNLIKGSEKELNLVVEMMRQNPEIEIFLSGHTDNQGKAVLNIKLSMDRVEVVKQYLISSGIDKKRVTGKGFGGSRPIASNANEESRKLNRRVEFTVHKTTGQQ